MSLKNYEKYKKSFDFRGIFTPTLTSELIIKFSEKLDYQDRLFYEKLNYFFSSSF